MRRLLSGILLTLALGACGSPAPTPTGEYDVAAEAMKAFEKADWVSAGRLLREAIVKRPMELRLHYSLGVTDTHLDLRDEAIREFRWVLANAPGTPEAQAARNWLLAAGALTTETTASSGSETAPPDPDRGSSILRGQVSWNDGEPPMKLSRLQIYLKGLRDTPNQDFQMVLRTDEEGRFEFKNVPAGTYQLTNRIAGEPLWRLRVQVEQGQTSSLDLTPQNSLRARDDFPDAK